MRRAFRQVDVFTAEPFRGNPVAVVLDGEGMDDAALRAFAAWTNLSETTFVLSPTPDGAAAGADYRVHILTPAVELPFAGHPTLGTCHAWLEAGGVPARPDLVVQECGAGLVPIRRGQDGLAFAAPPLVRSGPVAEEDLARVVAELGITSGDVVDAAWVDNGPGWVAVLLADADAVLALAPTRLSLDVGAVGLHPDGHPERYEVRGFFPIRGQAVEDPVTGSLNASVAQWLLGTGRVRAPYVAAQGTALDRRGRVRIEQDDDGTVWVGGGTITCVSGHLEV